MAVYNIETLLSHSGHSLSIYTYRNDKNKIESSTIECDDCNEVLIEFERTKEDNLDEYE